MSARADQRSGQRDWRSGPMPLQMPSGMRSSIPLPPTAREIRHEQRALARGFKRGAAFGFVFGTLIGAIATLFIVAVYRSVMLVIGSAT